MRLQPSANRSIARAVRYALSWRHPPGALADLPNLEVIFSLGAGVDHLFEDPGLPEKPIVRVVDPDLRDRMSEWVVMHALIHLRQLRRYNASRFSASGRTSPGGRRPATSWSAYWAWVLSTWTRR